MTRTEFISLFVTVFIMSVLAIFGNLIVMVAIIKSRPLRTTSNVFVCALAITDIYVAVVFSAEYLLNLLDASTNNITCVTLATMNNYGCFTNMLVIECISMDRFVAVYWPFKYRQICTKTRALCLCITVSLFSLLVCSLQFVVFKPGEYSTCWSGEMLTVPSATFMTTVTCCAALQLTIMYSAMFYKALDHHKNIRAVDIHTEASDVRISNMKAIKTCSLILGLFIFTWIPVLVVINITASSKEKDFTLFFDIFTMLPALNAVLDPIVYAIMLRDIRREIRVLFSRSKNAVTPSHNLTDFSQNRSNCDQ